ncbi:hypothetical protein Droror1_Dr00003098 [Drosera rotundifolia]
MLHLFQKQNNALICRILVLVRCWFPNQSHQLIVEFLVQTYPFILDELFVSECIFWCPTPKDALTTASSISFGSGQSLSNSYIIPLWSSFSARLDQEQAVAVPFNDASRIFEYQVSCPFSVTHGCCMMKRCPAFCIL